MLAPAKLAQPVNAGAAQVGLQHIGRPLWHGEQRGVSGAALAGVDELADSLGEVPAERHNIVPAVFAVGGGHLDGGRVQVGQVETPRRQAGQFRRAKAGFDGQPVKRRPVRPAQASEARPALGGGNQPGDFIVAQRPADQSPIGLGVQLVHLHQRIGAHPLVAKQPAGETFGRRQLGVDGPGAHALGSQVGHVSGHLAGVDVHQPLEFTDLGHGLDESLGSLDVLCGPALAAKGGDEFRQVLGERPSFAVRQLLGLGVDDPLASHHGVGFQLAGQGLGRLVVGAATHDLAVVRPGIVGDIVRAARFSLEDARHGSPTFRSF